MGMAGEHLYTHRVTRDGESIRSILRKELGMSRQMLIRLKRSGEVLQNGQPAYLNALAVSGDVLTIVLREEKTPAVDPEDIPLNIAFEDDYLTVVNKPPGLVVHPTKGYMTGTLAHALAFHWQTQGVPCVFRPVHRLDRDTSGLVIIAKNPHVQAVLTSQQHSGEWEKYYLAIVRGEIAATEGSISAPIARVGNGSRARAVAPEGRPALTLWQRLELFSGASLVRVRLLTGRTHQIRVHLAHIGHPVLGDDVYGGATPLIARQALHASEIAFTHPATAERVKVTAPLPADISALLVALSGGILGVTAADKRRED
ncbi:MAG: Ribosomal large subunit pseudouridine synthase D [Firmicutes bacterium]|nr:Ribosomal large subunit pseudouridine synthase D [candidate division NPL-UPA2 bacterium]